MKRFFVLAVVIALTACMGTNSWSQNSGGGGASGSGGAGASGGAGTAGAGGAAGTSGSATPGSGIGTAGNPGTTSGVGVGANPNGFGANPNVNPQFRPGGAAQQQAAQLNGGFNGISDTPFFSDPGAQRQLGMNRSQINQMNRAYRQALQNYNRGLSGMNDGDLATNPHANQAAGATNLARDGNTAGVNGVGGTPAERAQRLRNLQAQRQGGTRQSQLARDRAGVSGNVGANVNGNLTRRSDTTGTGVTNSNAGLNANGNATAAQQQALRMQELRSQFNSELSGAVDTTFTDPAMRRRFNQLNWQYQGVGAFNDPTVQQELRLTPQQRLQLDQLAAQWRQQMLALQGDARNNLTQAQFDDMRQQYADRLNTMLTPAQQQQWTQMVGDQYQFPYTTYFPPTGTTGGTTGTTGIGIEQAPSGIQTTSEPDLVPKSTARGTRGGQSTPSPRTR